MIYSIEKGLKEVQDFLHKIGISDDQIRILSASSQKLTWTLSNFKEKCNKGMFVVSAKTLRMYMIFFKIVSGQCMASFAVLYKADEYVPLMNTVKDGSFSIEELKMVIQKLEETDCKQSLKFLEKDYNMKYYRQCCDLFLENNPDFLKMMDDIFDLDFEKYVKSLDLKK